MKGTPLTPRTIINSEGKVYYSESNQAWNIVQLKKELFEEFPELKEKRSKFAYKLIYHRSSEDFHKAIRKLIREGNGIVPLLLFLYKEGENEK